MQDFRGYTCRRELWHTGEFSTTGFYEASPGKDGRVASTFCGARGPRNASIAGQRAAPCRSYSAIFARWRLKPVPGSNDVSSKTLNPSPVISACR